MKRFSLSGKGPVPGSTLLLILIALYSFAPAHYPPALSHSNTGLHTTASENRTDALRSSYGGSSYGGQASAKEDEPEETITGTVYDAAGPVMDVAVSIKGSGVVTYTDENGNYAIDASIGDVLIFTYPGYETLEITVSNQTLIDVELTQSITQLEEAVINAGYYTVKDKEKTGSISRVTADEIENQPIHNVLEALQGRVPGLEITPTTGLAGGSFTVKIRGQNSIAAGNEPLYIIDGVPYDMSSMGFKDMAGGPVLPGGLINPLNTLNPESIESIEVLKDADATAIYGSRGANGVILITTKKDHSGKISFNLKTSHGMAEVTRLPKLLNTEQYLKMRKEAFINDGLTEFPETAYDLNGTWDPDRYTDWQKTFLGNSAKTSRLELRITGGSKQTNFLIGGNLGNETTVFPGDYRYNRGSLFTNLSHQSKDERLGVQFSFNYGFDKNHLPGEDLTRAARILPPNAPALYDENGNLNWEESTWENPFAQLEGHYKNNSRNLIANGVFNYRLTKGFHFKTNLGFTDSKLTESKTIPHTVYDPAYGADSGWSIFQRNSTTKDSWIMEPQMDYSKEWGKGVLSITAGASFQERNFYQMVENGRGFPDNQFIENLNAAEEVTVNRELSSQYRYLAFYGRLNYNHDGKYILNLTGRRDGSSRFGPGKKFANFGAAGAAWVFSKEGFMDNQTWLKFGKLRLSYGVSGNDQIADNQYLNTFSISQTQYDNALTLYPTRLFNPDYAWEKNKKLDLALEGSFRRDILSFEINYYRNRSGNQLVGSPLPGTTGFTIIQENWNAKVENSGWEINLNSTLVKREKFNWNASFNLSFPKNKLLEFEGLDKSAYANRYLIGQPVTIVKLYHITGVDPETGVYTFEDYNGDGTINSLKDRQYIVDLAPEYYGGLSNTIRYANLQLQFLFQFVKKKGFNEYYGGYSPPGTMFNQPVGVLNHWQNPGDEAENQIYTSGYNYDAYLAYTRFETSNKVISDASFIRLKSLALTYTIPVKNKGFQSCTLSAQGYNLLTFTKYKGGDPEQSVASLPPLKRFTLGIELNF